jgi:hypothetical protein
MLKIIFFVLADTKSVNKNVNFWALKRLRSFDLAFEKVMYQKNVRP